MNTAHTGRFLVRDIKSGRRFCVEPLENRQETKVELQASETVVEDNKKYKGTIRPDQSVITEKHFKDIAVVENPLDEIERRLRG